MWLAYLITRLALLGTTIDGSSKDLGARTSWDERDRRHVATPAPRVADMSGLYNPKHGAAAFLQFPLSRFSHLPGDVPVSLL